MQKIGFLCTSHSFGGLEMNVLKLAHWLKARKWDLTFFSSESAKMSNEAIAGSLQTVFVERKKYFDIQNAYRLSRILKKQDIKVLFVFLNSDIEFVSLIKRFLYPELKVIYQQHMQIGVNKKDFVHTLRYRTIDYWISPLSYLKKEVMAKTNMNPDKIKVIPLCVDLSQYTSESYSKESARRQLELNPRYPLIGTIGRIDPKKGQDTLIHAIKKLEEREIHAELLMVGDPTHNDQRSVEYLSYLKDLVQQYNLSSKVHFRSHIKDTRLFYKAIDVFALASHAETYGMVTIEAMLSEVPIIASNTAGTPEILEYGKLGTLFKHNSTDDLCNQIIPLLSPSDQSMQTVLVAKKVAMEKYSHHKECEQIEALILTFPGA